MGNSVSAFVNHPVTETLYERGYTNDLMKKYGAGNTQYLPELVKLVQYICSVKVHNKVEFSEKFIIDCADRYFAGKKKYTMPYTQSNKNKNKERSKNLKQQGGKIAEYIEDAIINNEKVVTSYKNGNIKAIGALVGYILKKEKLDPAVVNSLLKEKLDSL